MGAHNGMLLVPPALAILLLFGAFGNAAYYWNCDSFQQQPQPSDGHAPPTFVARERRQQMPPLPGAGAGGETMRVHMVTIADEAFADRYSVYFGKMALYAERWGYSWSALAVEDYDEDVCPNIPPMYKGLCMVADFMRRSTREGDAVVFFDADYVPYRHHRSLERWLDAIGPANDKNGEDDGRGLDLVLYDRGMLDEIASGSYLARSSGRMVRFLMEWANYYYREPKGFSSADNGSMHIHLLRTLGMEPQEGGRCGNKYNNLTATVQDLVPYQDYLKCCREKIPIGRHHHVNHPDVEFSVWIVGRVDPWALDGVMEPKPREAKRGAVFHHGIKIQKKGVVGREWIQKYGLDNMTAAEDLR